MTRLQPVLAVPTDAAVGVAGVLMALKTRDDADSLTKSKVPIPVDSGGSESSW
jgi:hypothetical protein